MKQKTTQNFYSAMLDTAEKAGIKIITDDKCCQLLAWVYQIGGFTEESTHNKKLNSDIWIAAKRLNIYGGKTPNRELLPLFRKYYTEIDNFVQKKTSKPKWLEEFEKYYGLKNYKIS